MCRHFDRAVLAAAIHTMSSHALTLRELVAAETPLGWKIENYCSRTLCWVPEFNLIGGATIDLKN